MNLLAIVLASGLTVAALTREDSGKTVAVNVGQSITITLKGNPTTGYLWSVAGLSSNTVEQVGEVEYRQDETGKHLVGSGGVFVATFKAVKPGPTTVRMEYRRPWEKDVPPVERFAITLAVK
jgi:inhibitor of cysteine peptidase